MGYKDPALDRAYHKKYDAAHRDESRRRSAAWYAANPHRARIARLKLNYGITEEQYNLMLDAQDGCCALCRSPEPGGKGDWHVDHCHETGKVRGLLCHGCNIALAVAEQPNWLLRAGSYLER
jgi:hypothetical protein